MKKFLLAASCLLLAAAGAPAPGTMAMQTDGADFVSRNEADLSFNNRKLRIGGFNIPWLGLRVDAAEPGGMRLPTNFELNDVLSTVFLMGGGYVRSVSLGVTAGCAECVVTATGQVNPAAIARIDHVLKLARDKGIKLTIPLLGGAGPCPPDGPVDPVAGAACGFARAYGKPDSAFFTDPQLRAAFVHVVTGLLTHLNPETSIVWKDDPAIMAWENCDRCGIGNDPATVANWTEYLGAAIKAVDTRHLYQNGAFAGRLALTPGNFLATPSVDIVADRFMPAPGSPADGFTAANQAVAKTGRVYVINAYGWAPNSWRTVEDFQAFNDRLWENRTVAGAFVQSLSGHAESGGYLRVPRGEDPVLYFPGAAADGMDAAAMLLRARIVRHLSYHMLDYDIPGFGHVDPPSNVTAVRGRLTWRGAAGAASYSISRSTDVTLTGSWDVVCDKCVTDDKPFWQDPNPNPATTPTWYRMTSFNANGHTGIDTEPVRNK